MIYVKADDGYYYRGPKIGAGDWYVKYDGFIRLFFRATGSDRGTLLRAAVQQLCDLGYCLQPRGAIRYSKQLDVWYCCLRWESGFMPVSLLLNDAPRFVEPPKTGTVFHC